MMDQDHGYDLLFKRRHFVVILSLFFPLYLSQYIKGPIMVYNGDLGLVYRSEPVCNKPF